MITENQLFNAGYSLKTNLINGSKDLVHPDQDIIVNLDMGNITVSHPINSTLPSFSTSDIDEFLAWHNEKR